MKIILRCICGQQNVLIICNVLLEDFFAGYSLNCGYECRAMFKEIRDSLKEDSFIDKHKRIYEIIQKYFLDEYTFSKCYFVYSRKRGNSKDEVNQRHNDI